MKKQIFKVGDRVFYYTKGWGTVKRSYEGMKSPASICVSVDFDDKSIGVVYFTYRQADLLSFTEYTLQGNSQERPIDYNDYVGKWGKFYDEEDEEFYSFTIHRLLKYNKEEGHFVLVDGDRYVYSNYFQPLTEEQIKILKLQDDNKK